MCLGFNVNTISVSARFPFLLFANNAAQKSP